MFDYWTAHTEKEIIFSKILNLEGKYGSVKFWLLLLNLRGNLLFFFGAKLELKNIVTISSEFLPYLNTKTSCLWKSFLSFPNYLCRFFYPTGLV